MHRTGDVGVYSSTLANLENCDDVEQLKLANKELLIQVQRYQRLVDQFPDMITRFDKQMRHLYIN